jgi:hypothetical protein
MRVHRARAISGSVDRAVCGLPRTQPGRQGVSEFPWKLYLQSLPATPYNTK